MTVEQLAIVEDYLTNYGLHLEKHYEKFNTFTLFKGSTPITSQLEDKELANFLINVFDPHQIKKTYIANTVEVNGELSSVQQNNKSKIIESKIEKNDTLKVDQSSVQQKYEPETISSKIEKINRAFPKKEWSNTEQPNSEIEVKKLNQNLSKIPGAILKVLSILFLIYLISVVISMVIYVSN